VLYDEMEMKLDEGAGQLAMPTCHAIITMRGAERNNIYEESKGYKEDGNACIE
jgi:hypothetical protein